MGNHVLQTTPRLDEVTAASDRWWSAHESGAPAEVVERLWSDLDRLSRSYQQASDGHDLETRFGWQG